MSQLGLVTLIVEEKWVFLRNCQLEKNMLIGRGKDNLNVSPSMNCVLFHPKVGFSCITKDARLHR